MTLEKLSKKERNKMIAQDLIDNPAISTKELAKKYGVSTTSAYWSMRAARGEKTLKNHYESLEQENDLLRSKFTELGENFKKQIELLDINNSHLVKKLVDLNAKYQEKNAELITLKSDNNILREQLSYHKAIVDDYKNTPSQGPKKQGWISRFLGLEPGSAD